MTIEVLSYILALVTAAVCYGLIKHTTDEFDRWYTDPALQANFIPVSIVGVVAGVIVTAAIFLR